MAMWVWGARVRRAAVHVLRAKYTASTPAMWVVDLVKPFHILPHMVTISFHTTGGLELDEQHMFDHHDLFAPAHSLPVVRYAHLHVRFSPANETCTAHPPCPRWPRPSGFCSRSCPLSDGYIVRGALYTAPAPCISGASGDSCVPSLPRSDRLFRSVEANFQIPSPFLQEEPSEAKHKLETRVNKTMQDTISSRAHTNRPRSMDIPGARWFKADLHIHTIDDHAGGRAKMPADIVGDNQSPTALSEYARRFLQSAVDSEVQVLGITPHSPRIGDSDGASAVWQIVDEWRTGTDNSGTPFRDTIYAIFPGFEPSFPDGKSGLHLLFLFDPEIGRNLFMKTFDMVMGNVSPWPNGSSKLKLSSLHAADALERLSKFHKGEHSGTRDSDHVWEYLVLAPHIEAEKGLFGTQRAQVSEQFPHAEIAGLELGDNRLPEDLIKHKRWLQTLATKHNQSFFHGSDAYKVDDIGRCYTWIKISSPRIAALRQALIAGHSRTRIAYERDVNGALSAASETPDGLDNGRPWLRTVTVSGAASFFGSDDGHVTCARFDFSPDLTCIIGGSMTGKSTLLDGLRVHTEAHLPQDSGIREQVEARGRGRFLAGSPEVTLDCPGTDPTAPPSERWPAVFYAQSELQRLAENPEIMEILSRLAASEKDRIIKIEEDLDELDGALSRNAKLFADISDRLADAEQAYERSRQATEVIAALSDAGIGDLARASAEAHQWRESAETVSELESKLADLAGAIAEYDIPQIGEQAASALRGKERDLTDPRAGWDRVCYLLSSAKEEAGVTNAAIRLVAESLEAHESDVKIRISRQLAERGHDGATIDKIQTINAQASLMESCLANLQHMRSELDMTDKSFTRLHAKRRELVALQRSAYDQVIETIFQRFEGTIKARRIDWGDADPLDGFIRGLGQRGITRWWNDLADDKRPTPETLLKKAEDGCLVDVGMSETVASSFLAHLTAARRREMGALRSRDVYRLEFRMGDETYRQLADLSGGQRVSLLLSLLLETDDERPLVIDQPEDELDNRFLFETLLPALRRLKGRRQVVLATHNANIVVNGDADQIIHLEATANRGWVAHSGSIDEPAVRNAIIGTVDGGEEAFRMRNLKYGF